MDDDECVQRGVYMNSCATTTASFREYGCIRLQWSYAHGEKIAPKSVSVMWVIYDASVNADVITKCVEWKGICAKYIPRLNTSLLGPINLTISSRDRKEDIYAAAEYYPYSYRCRMTTTTSTKLS